MADIRDLLALVTDAVVTTRQLVAERPTTAGMYDLLAPVTEVLAETRQLVGERPVKVVLQEMLALIMEAVAMESQEAAKACQSEAAATRRQRGKY